MGPGTILDGKYEIVDRIGAGGMGEVFKARHLHLNALRCIKVMKPALLADEVYRARFLREARLATQIHHPNIAVVHDFFLGDGGSYLVTEFIDGSTVRQWSTAYGKLPVALAADVASQVLAGLDHIHRRGLLHRDISADNVMLTFDDEEHLVAKIIDLGVAKELTAAAGDTTQAGATTQAGMLIGNPKYMSPEQFGFVPEGEQMDGRADLYSLGVVLYEMLVGASPFTSDTPQGYIMKHLMQPPAFATVHCPPQLETVVLRALEKDRNRRFADARSMAAALEPFRSGPPGSIARDDITRLRSGEEPTLVVQPAAPAAETETETERDWKKSMAEDTARAFREYLDKHPQSKESSEAKARLFELSLLETIAEKERAGDREALKRLAAAHQPSTLIGNAVREALARLKPHETPDDPAAFDAAWESGSSAAWERYLANHAGSPRAAEAARCREEALGFERAVEANSVSVWRAFLKTWPEGRHRLDADIRLRSLK
jgi:serine/threonine protein kinase